MEATAYFKNLHISPKKLRFLLDEIKKMKPEQALDHLYYSPKRTAKVFYKAIKSAIDNAKYTLKVDGNLLEFKLLTVEQGNVLKRYRPGGRGTAKPYKKRFSHIKVILQAKGLTKKSVEVKKEAPKTEVKTETKKELPIVPPVQKEAKKPSVKRGTRKKDGTKS